jgi:hypothetical protein
METADWGGIITVVFLGALMLGCWMGWLIGRHGVLPIRGVRVESQRQQLQVLAERPNGERVWADVAGEQAPTWI